MAIVDSFSLPHYLGLRGSTFTEVWFSARVQLSVWRCRFLRALSSSFCQPGNVFQSTACALGIQGQIMRCAGAVLALLGCAVLELLSVSTTSQAFVRRGLGSFTSQSVWCVAGLLVLAGG